MVWVVSLSDTELSPRALTPGLWSGGIRSLTEFGKLVGPLVRSVLYLRRRTPEAAPKGISGRTSYLPVRLEFLLYAQLIR